MDSEAHNAAEEPEFFDGRIMLQIDHWNWSLHLGRSSEYVPKEYRFQGGLNYSRSIDITGRVRAPSADRGRKIWIHVSPFGPELDFGDGEPVYVGQFSRDRPDRPADMKGDLEATLLLPEAALAPAMTCLSSVWRYLDIWIDRDGEQASVTNFCFSDSIHPNLADWAGPELE